MVTLMMDTIFSAAVEHAIYIWPNDACDSVIFDQNSPIDAYKGALLELISQVERSDLLPVQLRQTVANQLLSAKRILDQVGPGTSVKSVVIND